ncbi:MAG: CHASE3 domain-containing protein [Cyanosarcina radialis HA8281-LM2]|nr:CHASE3 domain-containing protein [Cyanosarcina radialis HA8281-LM2]
MKWSVEGKWITGGFVLAVLLMGVTNVISYQNATRLAESTDKLKQTHEVLEDLVGILAALDEAESARRSYILLGDESELKRYRLSIPTIDAQIQALERQMTSNPNQQQRLNQLNSSIARRMVLSRRSLELKQQDSLSADADSAMQVSLQAASNQNRRQIRQTIDQMQQEEQTALAVWIEQSQSSIRWRMAIEATSTFLTFAILFGIYAVLYRQMMKRYQAETDRLALAKAKELGELKLEFFSLASHEFRTPLSLILGSAQLLEESLQPLVEKKKLKNLARIQSAARLMTQLLSDILTLARAEAGRLEFNPTLVEIQSFCLNLVEDMQLTSKVQPKIQFAHQGSRTHVWVDEKLLYSILSNLLSNAIKYSPPERDIYFRLSCEPEVLTFEIEDRGIGIPLENQQELYEPFQRGKNVKEILGTGLGLAVIKKCLDLHQGHISVKSEVGVGTTFTVTIRSP